MKPRLPPAPEIEWRDGAPHAQGDVYYSKAGGLAETEAVFLAGCGLPDAWRGRRTFTIVELGYGTGLNALATMRLWAKTRTPGSVLHFCSIEAAPLDVADARRALAAFPEIAPQAERLLDVWPVRAQAPQRFWFDDFALTLLIGDAAAMLRGFAGEADAWFLDGFAPDRNPEMWSEEAMRLVAARSAPDARLATYSVAGAVRRNLEAAGFVTEKRPGFGAKRERLEARLARAPQRAIGPSPYGACEGRVAIVGAGIAGASLAHALHRRGRECLVVDAGAKASPAALVMPQFDRGGGAQAEWRLAAFLHAALLYEGLGLMDRCGAWETLKDPAAFADLAEDPPLPADWLAAEAGRLFHRRAGVVAPRDVLAVLTDGVPRIGGEVARLKRAGDAWRLLDANGATVAEAEAVAICAGARLAHFEETNWLKLRLTHGQLERADDVKLETALAASSYAAPAGQGIVFGATFDRTDMVDAPGPDGKARQRNLAALAKLAPDIRPHGERMVSHTGVRAAAPDYAPIAGLMPNAPAWRAAYAALRHGRFDSRIAPPTLPGLYVFGALSARGFTHAPLLAERLAAEMNGELPPLSQNALEALHPARFLRRALKRNE